VKFLLLFVLTVMATLLFKLFTTPEWQIGLSQELKTILIPIVAPILELINTPSFVYVASSLILLTAIIVSCLYYTRVLSPRRKELRALCAEISLLPREGDGVAAMKKLGDVLRSRGLFVSAWASFQASVTRDRGIPDRPFSYFVASDPTQDEFERGGFMQALPGYFTWLGLILTFIGLVVALYFAARGFRSGDIAEARTSILQLLNASSFKFLTSVAALSGALLVSIAYRFCLSQLRTESERTVAYIEAYVSLWRDLMKPRHPATDSLTTVVDRLDLLIASVNSLTVQMQKVADRLETEGAHVQHAAE